MEPVEAKVVELTVREDWGMQDVRISLFVSATQAAILAIWN